MTYTITERGISCHRCGWTSAHPKDIAERYCGHCHIFHDEVIVEGLIAELSTLRPMELGLRAGTAFQLTGLLQLALRHPAIGSDVRLAGEHLLTALREYFAECPTLSDVIRRGDDPSEDR